MELLLEILNSTASASSLSPRKTFTHTGGVIGRAEHCDWVIVDGKRHVSNRHARISCHDGRFFITDISSNGVRDHTRNMRLPKHEAVPVEHNGIYVLGDFHVRARWSVPPAMPDVGAARTAMTGEVMPDNTASAQPLLARHRQPGFTPSDDALFRESRTVDEIVQCADYARIDTEYMQVPTLVTAAAEPAVESVSVERQPDDFWNQFGVALGVDLEGLDHQARQTLALKAARLLKQCVGGVQQSLSTRTELKNELRLARTSAQVTQQNPLKCTAHAGEALTVLLNPEKPGQWQASRAIATAFRELQAHQIALLAASRAAVRSTLEHFAPAQLALRFERDHKTWMTTSGSHWRAYGRYHHALCQDDDWSERLLARDFAQAYEEQVRLIATLHTDLQG